MVSPRQRHRGSWRTYATFRGATTPDSCCSLRLPYSVRWRWHVCLAVARRDGSIPRHLARRPKSSRCSRSLRQKSEQLGGLLEDYFRAILNELVPCAKAPRDPYRLHPSGDGGLHVGRRIAHVQALRG